MVTQDSGHPDARRRPSTLDPFLGRTWPEAPPEVRPLLERLEEEVRSLHSREHRITVLGAFKTGKSSLINALAGAPVLPVQDQEGTQAVTHIRYGEVFQAQTQNDGVTGEIAPGDLVQSIVGKGERDIEIRVEAPLPLLDHLWEIADTPGLFRSAEVTARSMSQMVETDLAVLVLAADQLLSARERAAAAQIDRLLHGNIIYVLNRMDTVEQNEREDVLAWARHTLEGSGNALVGRPCIVPASTLPTRQEGIDELRDQLLGVCTTEVGDRVAMLSRLGRIEATLIEIAGTMEDVLERREEALAQARAGSSQALDEERAAIRRRIQQARRRLQAEADSLSDLDEGFLSRCVEETWHALQHAPTGAGQGLVLEGALSWYAAQVNEDVQSATLDLPMTVAPWDPSTWLVRADVHAASHPTTDVGMALGGLLTQVLDGGQTGREVGKKVGGWLGKNVFGVDVEADTRARIERPARGILPALRVEAEQYIGRVDTLAVEADHFYAQWTHLSPQVADLERAVAECRRLNEWLGELRDAVRALLEE